MRRVPDKRQGEGGCWLACYMNVDLQLTEQDNCVWVWGAGGEGGDGDDDVWTGSGSGNERCGGE